MEEMIPKQATRRRRRRRSHNNTARNSDSDAAGMIMNLPRDIIYEILSRLPIESVLRCMSVCKFWSTFLYDSYFIDLHFTKSMMHHRPPTLVLTTSLLPPIDNKMSSQLMVSAEEGEGGDWRKATHIPIGDFELVKGEVIDIVGSCNGFLCIAPRIGLGLGLGLVRICLHNPTTRETMKLPKSHLFIPPKNSSTKIQNSVGFGIGSLSKKYKVIVVYELFGYDWSKIIRYSEIITVGESSWRKLDFPTLSYDQLLTDPVLLDGTLYRLIVIDDDYYNQYVLALDIDSEKFWTIDCCPLPIRRESIRRRYLVPMDGSLALIDNYACTNPWRMDIWLLEGSKTMGFSFTLTTYDMSELVCWGNFFTVMGKHSHDTFLLNVSRVEDGNPTMKSSVILYSPTKKQQYFCVQGELYESDLFLKSWMVPSLKSLSL
ncbi:F-box protein At5g18160-like [Macadamia integrifolia]|uniref:F-box protein At5g18160-like n=1 Tax=Macadamia integrifolia TaxID=60698 RepID=UPI001C4F43E2|nr:F-box protein At5g18160-like [Macadamia integrifolia]